MITAVTGASGYLGGAIVRSLIAEGRSIRAIDLHRGPTLDDLPIEFVQGDILDSASLNHALNGVEVVYHLAAMIAVAGESPDLVWNVNVHGAHNVAQASLRAGVRRLVHCSSVHAFDLESELPEVTETSPRTEIKSRPVYDRSKAAGEVKVREAIAEGLDAVIVNPTGVIGPLDYAPSRMGQVFTAMFTNSLPGLPQGGFDWVDLRDVAAGTLEAERSGATGENYLLPGHHASIEELAAIAADVSGVESTARSVPMWMARVWGPIGNLLGGNKGTALAYTSDSLHALRYHPPISGAKAAAELGHRPRSTRESIEDIYGWFASRGALEIGD
jgi:dihydroflavonol-4-reductase